MWLAIPNWYLNFHFDGSCDLLSERRGKDAANSESKQAFQLRLRQREGQKQACTPQEEDLRFLSFLKFFPYVHYFVTLSPSPPKKREKKS